MKRIAVVQIVGGVLAALACAQEDGSVGPDLPQPVPPALSYDFGAKFEPPSGRVVHGMGLWVDYNPHYLGLLPAAQQPAAELMFIETADSNRPWNPTKLGQALQHMSAQGWMPLVDIGLRGNQPLPAQLDTMADKLYAIDDEVAHGTKWDGRLGDLVQVFRSFGKPMLVRIGGEFNGWWNGYHPYDYPRAFRKIVGMFRAAGVENVAFVWCYEPAAPADFDAMDASGAAKWVGVDVVDWYSVDLYAKGDISGQAAAHGVLTPYGKTLKFLDLALLRRKPVVIAESSPAFYDLGNPVQAQAAWGEWFVPYFQLIAARAEIKWFHYVNYDWTKGTYYASQGWKNNDLAASASVAQLYAAELGNPKYLHSSEKALLKDYAKYP